MFQNLGEFQLKVRKRLLKVQLGTEPPTPRWGFLSRNVFGWAGGGVDWRGGQPYSFYHLFFLFKNWLLPQPIRVFSHISSPLHTTVVLCVRASERQSERTSRTPATSPEKGQNLRQTLQVQKVWFPPNAEMRFLLALSALFQSLAKRAAMRGAGAASLPLRGRAGGQMAKAALRGARPKPPR